MKLQFSLKKILLIMAFFAFATQAQITLETTVAINTDPGNPNFDFCGTDKTLVVDPGTPILFCFRATNIGPYPYNLQDASSPHFGTTLHNFPFTLQPGANVWLTERENVTSTVVLDGTWTAHNDSLSPRYIIKDITYNFNDISLSGTDLGMGDDDEVNITLPFNFLLSGIYSNKMTVGNNGAIKFGETSVQISNNNHALGSTTNENYIAPLWDDLTPSNTAPLGHVYYETIGTAPNRVAIVQWSNQNHFDIGTGVSPTAAIFEVKLFETTNEIQFHYQDVLFGDDADNGATATVGIGGDSNAIEHSYNQASLINNSALSFTRPESVGYIVTKSGEIGGPAYDFVDIFSTGTPLNIGDEEEIGVTMDFAFFLSNYSSKFITIGNNGAIRLGQQDANVSYSNSQLADDKSQNIIAPFWDDLSDSQGNVYYQTIGSAPFRTFIVQWDKRPHFQLAGDTVGTITFEMKLFESQNKIEFHYKNVDFDTSSQTNTGYDFGKSATVGIAGGIHAAQYSYNSTDISNNMALMFAPIPRSASDTDSANVIVNVPDIDVTNYISANVFDPNPSAGFNLSFDNLGTYDLNWSANDCGTSASWLALDAPLSGTLVAGATAQVHLSISASGLTYGTYNDDVCIDSNDPDEPTKIVQIAMNYISDTIFENGFE